MARNRKKMQWTYEIYLDLYIRKQADHDPMPEMIHFLTEHKPFAAKLAQMNLKDIDKCTCDNEQTTKHLWVSCPKNELKHLHNIESNFTKILWNKDKYKEF